jgi:hypothetical protein
MNRYGFLIDPFARTITVEPYDGDYRAIHQYIEAECFDAARLNREGDCVFVDDVGLLNEPEYFFRFDDRDPYAGKGFVLGTDDEGESISPTLTLDELKARVRFYQLVRIGNIVGLAEREAA